MNHPIRPTLNRSLHIFKWIFEKVKQNSLAVSSLLILAIIWLFGIQLIPFIAEYIYPGNALSPPKSYGEFGDMYGSMNAFFSGLALIGVVITIYLQKKELQAQREELKDTRIEFHVTRLQNVIYRQLERIEDTIDSAIFFKQGNNPGQNGILGLSMFIKRFDVLANKSFSHHESVRATDIADIEKHSQLINEIFNLILRSIRLMDKLISQNNDVTHSVKDDLILIFNENLTPLIDELLQVMFLSFPPFDIEKISQVKNINSAIINRAKTYNELYQLALALKKADKWGIIKSSPKDEYISLLLNNNNI